MNRHVLILRRRPPTRRERVVARLQSVRPAASRRWARLRHPRRRREAQRLAQALFLQMTEKMSLEPQPAGRTRTARLHVRLRHPHR